MRLNLMLFFSGASNLQELQLRLANKIMIRRMKEDVLKQLPPKVRQKIPFELKDSTYKKVCGDSQGKISRDIILIITPLYSPRHLSSKCFIF